MQEFYIMRLLYASIERLKIVRLNHFSTHINVCSKGL